MAKKKIITLIFVAISTLTACSDNNNNYTNAKQLLLKQPCEPLNNKCEVLLPDGTNNIQLQLSFKAPPSYQRLLPIRLESSNDKLEDISITMIIDGKEMPPEKMEKDENQKVWEAQLLPFATVTKDNIKLRLLVSYKSEQYFSEFDISY